MYSLEGTLGIVILILVLYVPIQIALLRIDKVRKDRERMNRIPRPTDIHLNSK